MAVDAELANLLLRLRCNAASFSMTLSVSVAFSRVGSQKVGGKRA
jgi:hypothetical protein